MVEVRPWILAVDDEPEVLAAVVRDLRSHYGAEYRIVSASGGVEAIETLNQLSLAGDPLALVVADQRMPEVTGLDVLRATVDAYPEARKVLLTAYADTEAAISAINDVGLDHYIMKPWDPPTELLYPILDDLLEDWHAGYRPTFSGLRVVAGLWSREAHELKAMLSMNQIPYRATTWGDDPEADRLVEAAGASAEDLPLVILESGETLSRPSFDTLAARVGLNTRASQEAYDLVVVGGGPAGLAASVYGSSEGLKTVLIEGAAPGGQAGQSSLIENYLGFPRGLSGADLARRASTQAKRFGTEILVPANVERVERRDPFRIIHLADGSQITTKALVIASGIAYRRLQATGLDDLIGTGVYYGTSRIEAENHRDRPMFVVGGGNSAGQAAMFLTRFTDAVTIVIRRPSLITMSQYLVDQIEAHPSIKVIPVSQLVEAGGEGHLEWLLLENLESGERTKHDAEALFVFIGQKANSGWLAETVQLDDQGFVLTGADLGPLRGWNVERDPLPFETSVPGVFAAGDVRHGSIRRVAGAVGEGSSAIRFVHKHLVSL